MSEPPIKSPEAFRTISEVAEELDLPQHVLRFWETRFGQIKPMKRGGGRRYYRPEDIALLRGIRVLLYSEGFTIRGVQRLLKEKGTTFVSGVGQAGNGDAPPVAPASSVPSNQPDEPDETAASESDRPGLAAPAAPAAPAAEPSADAGHAARSNDVAGAGQQVSTDRGSAKLPQEARRALESALSNLLDAKRMLDQAR